jgi:uncharacterized protein (DUF2267 family)
MSEGSDRVGAVLGSPFVGSADDFFERIQASGALPADLDPRDAAAAVLCAVTQRLSLAEGRDVIDALPPGVQAVFQRCNVHRDFDEEPPADREQLVGLVGAHLEVEPDDAEEIARAVLTALRAQLPRKEVHDVESQLPADLVALFRGG